METIISKELIPKGQAKLLKIGSVFADLGILGIYDNTIGKPVYQGDGLPKELYSRSRSLMSNSGDVYRMFYEKMK